MARIPSFSASLAVTLSLFAIKQLPTLAAADESIRNSRSNKNKRIAIIGGGISGSFAAKYLASYDSKCELDRIDIYDPSPITDPDGPPTMPLTISSSSEIPSDYRQGGRVASITLDNGQVVEVGASIVHVANKLVAEVIDADPNLAKAPPMQSGNKFDDDSNDEGVSEAVENKARGLGIWDGHEFTLLTTSSYKLLRKLKILYRYNTDLIRLDRAARKALTSFESIYELLDSHHPQTFFESPDELWDTVGLLHLTLLSLDELMDDIGIAARDSVIPGMGNLRKELVTAINLCNYNQNNAQLNGLVGLISFLPAEENDLFSIRGGNHQLISSSLKQAQSTHTSHCKTNENDPHTKKITHIPKTVTTVVSDSHEMELQSGNDILGRYDVVILAAPLQQCQISFYVQSFMDSAVLHQMPLNGVVNPDHDEPGSMKTEEREGHPQYAIPLPSSAKRPYTQVITTVISNVTSLNHTHFGVKDQHHLPKSIFVTDNGKLTDQFQSISRLTKDGVYKCFSSHFLSQHFLNNIFGPHHVVEHVKAWGGENGGATPDYAGGGKDASVAARFLLYDGGLGLSSEGGPALYYVNAIEAAAAAIEISAIGAKATAKLVARRLALIQDVAEGGDGVVSEEL